MRGRKAASLGKIRLELVRNPSYPEGSSNRGYEFLAPLGDDGHLDLEEWDRVKKRGNVRRFRAGEDDEAFLHLETHVFKVNE